VTKSVGQIVEEAKAAAVYFRALVLCGVPEQAAVQLTALYTIRLGQSLQIADDSWRRA